VLNGELITPKTATALLAGLIAATQNFQLAVNPQTLFSAAYLVSKGADNEMIVRQLYKTRSLNMVKLWGLVISRFYYNNYKKIGWSFIGADDLEKGVLEISHIPSVINELKRNFSDADVLVLGVGRDKNSYLAVVNAKEPSVLKGFAKKYGLSIKNSSLVLRAASSEDPSVLTQKIVEEIEKA
jgi:nanoRNase/pAp phosphatase (c-di-AMP/oligoRNAs hydrolase)